VKNKVLVYGVLLGVLAGFWWMLSYYRSSQVAESRGMMEKRDNMTRAVSDYERKKALFEQDYGQFAAPVPARQIDQLQGALVRKMAAYGLEVRSLTKKNENTSVPPIPNGPPSKDFSRKGYVNNSDKYEAIVVGNMQKTMSYLNDLRTEALIVVTSVRMEADASASAASAVKTTFGYKIFKE